jgi:transposase
MSTAGHSPTAVSDAPWALLRLLLPNPQGRPGGPGRTPLDLRRVLTGICSVNKTGGQGRMRPQELGPGPTSDGSCRRWRREGGWERLMATRRHWERPGQGRWPEPSAAWAARQSIKTATQGTESALTATRKATAVNGLGGSIPSGSWWRSSSPRPIRMIDKAWSPCCSGIVPLG